MADLLTTTPVPAALRDVVLRPGEDGFDAEVTGFNVAVTHRPDVVVVARTTEDVASAVRYAVAAGLPVGVQATGHGALVAQQGGLLISTRRMQEVRIDAAARTATVGAGVRWRAVLDAAAPHGLTGLCGSTSDVGVVGYTLGGGMPVLGRAFGFAADHVRRARLVTADGEIREVDPTREPALFAALRGGGGNLGVVTELTFELLPLTHLYGGGLFFRGEDAAAVLRTYAAWLPGVPSDLCSSVAFLRLPPLPEIPEPLRGRFTMHVRIAYPGDPAAGERLVAPLRGCAEPVLDALGTLPCTRLDLIHQDPDHPVPFVERGWLLGALDDATVATLLAQAGPDSGCPLLLVEVRHLGGALLHAPAHPNSIGARGDGFAVSGIGALLGPAAALVPGALDGLERALAPHVTGGSFLNLHGEPRDDRDRARPWTAEQYDRLRRVKRTVDPANLFRFGHALTAAR